MTQAKVTGAAARTAKHEKRMALQGIKHTQEAFDADGVLMLWSGLKVPRGTARNLRRKHLQVAYFKRQVIEQQRAAKLAEVA